MKPEPCKPGTHEWTTQRVRGTGCLGGDCVHNDSETVCGTCGVHESYDALMEVIARRQSLNSSAE